MVDGTNEHLRLAGTRLATQHAVLGPVRRRRVRVGRAVQEPLVLGQTANDVLEDGVLMWRERVEAFHRQRLQTADGGVNDPYTPQIQHIVQGNDVGHNGGDEAVTMGLLLELAGNLGPGGPVLQMKKHCL